MFHADQNFKMNEAFYIVDGFDVIILHNNYFTITSLKASK